MRFNRRRKRLVLEHLEPRILLAVDVATNVLEPLDVNGDTMVDIRDAREVVSALQVEGHVSNGFVDTNGDGVLTPNDLRPLLVQMLVSDSHGPTIEAELIEAPPALLPGLIQSLVFGRVRDFSGVDRLELHRFGSKVADIDVDSTTGFFSAETTYSSNHLSLVAMDNTGNVTTVATSSLVSRESATDYANSRGQGGGEGESVDSGPGFQIKNGTLHFVGTQGNDSAWLVQVGSQSLMISPSISPHFLYLPASVTHIEFDARGGNDTMWLLPGARMPITFLGGDGDDLFFGGSGADLVKGGDGNDVVHSYGGSDVVYGGPGRDFVSVGSGDDMVDAGEGDDYVTGGGGDDLLRGGADNDILAGGIGNDILLGGEGRDVQLGNVGHDLLIGGLGADQLLGNRNQDVLIGGTTEFDRNDAALREILQEWISSGAQGSKLSANSSLPTVFDDRATDRLVDYDPPNWFFPGPTDQTTASSTDLVDVAIREPLNFAVTSDNGVQQAPSIAVDPSDADHVVIVYMDYSLRDTGYAGIGFASSTNGGLSWKHGSVPVPAGFEQGAANPNIVFDHLGNVYVSYMAATFLGDVRPGITNPEFGPDRVPGFESNNGVFVVRSEDGGESWGAPVPVVSHLYDGMNKVAFDVNPDIAIDMNPTLSTGEPNQNYGNVYVVWTRAYVPGAFPETPDAPGGTELRFAVSRNGGLAWETQPEDEKTELKLDANVDPGPGTGPGEGFVDYPHIVVGADSEIYVSFFAGGNFGINVSQDGGTTFQAPDFIAGNQIVFGNSGFDSGMTSGLPNTSFRTHEKRALAADPTQSGVLYAVEGIDVGDDLGNIVDPGEVYFGRSNDFAFSWETVITVGSNPDLDELVCGQGAGLDCVDPNRAIPLNDDNGAVSAMNLSSQQVAAGQAHPQIATDEQGNVAVIWYDQRRDANDVRIDVFGAVSTDHGHSFSSNFRISTQSFDANQGAFINAIGEDEFYFGDFIGLAMGGGKSYAAWTDTRHGSQDIFFSRFSTSSPPLSANDRFEPNDDLIQDGPTMLEQVIQRTVPRLTVAPRDIDLFHVRASSRGKLTVDVEFDEPEAVPVGAVMLELWDGDGSSLLATAQDLINNGQIHGKQIEFPAKAGQEFLIRVTGTGSDEVAYGMQLNSLTADLGTRVLATIDESLQTNDEVLYLIETAAAGLARITLSAPPSFAGDGVFRVLDPQSLDSVAPDTLLSSGQSTTVDIQVQQGDKLLLQLKTDDVSSGNVDLEYINLDLFSVPGSNELVFPIPGGPSQSTIADVNNDGNLDVAVVGALSDTLSILNGNGDGLLQAPRQFLIGAFTKIDTDVTAPLPTFGRDVVAAHFDSDGSVDFVTTNSASADISLLLGQGDGTLQPQRRFEATPAPFDLDVGDVNGDGLLDIVVIETAIKNEVLISALLNRGDGTFEVQRTTPLAVSGNNGTIRLGDLNEDGRLDVVATGDGGPPLGAILLGNGDGTFTFFNHFDSSRRAVALAVADINGDGHLDIVNAGFGDDPSLSISLGNGDGTVQPRLVFSNGESTTGIQIVDLGSQVELPGGSTMFGPPDGRPDVLLAITGLRLSESGVPNPEVVVRPSLFDETGQFIGVGEPKVLGNSEVPQDVDVGDLDQDGKLDVVVTDRDGIRVIYGQPPSILPSSTPATARDLGAIAHLVSQTRTVVPGQEDVYFKMTVPTEAVAAAGDEVIDFSAFFQHEERAGLAMEVFDSSGGLIGSGERFRVAATQGEELLIHVFGVADNNGTRGAGAFTLVIDVLPQVVSVEAQALLPGTGANPGGPTVSLVLTLQGDRLDRALAEDPANYTVVALGPDNTLGTGDDLTVEVSQATYSPSSNIDVSSGRTFPTAVRQTVTLVFDSPLPIGSYQIEVANVQAAAFNDEELELLTDVPGFNGHPVVQLNGSISEAVVLTANDLVLPTVALGDVGVFSTGTPFLTQLHADLGSVLDAALTELGDDPSVTQTLIDRALARLAPSLGPFGSRVTSLFALILDPVSIDLSTGDGDVTYDLDTDMVTNDTDLCYVEVGGNVEVIVCGVLNDTETFNLTVGDATDVSRGGAILLTEDEDVIDLITDDLRGGETLFSFEL